MRKIFRVSYDYLMTSTGKMIRASLLVEATDIDDALSKARAFLDRHDYKEVAGVEYLGELVIPSNGKE